MQQHEDNPVLQVTKWAITPVYCRDSIAVRLDYVATAQQQRGQHHLLTPEQAIAIAHELLDLVKVLGIDMAAVQPALALPWSLQGSPVDEVGK